VRLATVRSGEIESTHEVSIVATDTNGRVIRSWGEQDLSFFYRSAIKPFQATVTLEAGAELTPEQLAVTCSSHGGYPIHRGLVMTTLVDAGLSEDDLQCPPLWPRDAAARDLLVAAGHRQPRPLFNNCSGKHSGWLAAAAGQGWSTSTYLEISHPIQQRVVAIIKEVTGTDPEPIGVDGCGAPTMRGHLTGLARAFGTLSIDTRFAAPALAMKRFPALVSSNNLNEGKFAAWWGGPVKGGAQGLIAAGRNGFGLAAKSHEGDVDKAIAGLIEALRQLAMLSTVAQDALVDVTRVPVLGGGRQVGTIEPISD